MPSSLNKAISRPRLEKIVSEALRAPLTLLCAPVGSGKSTLLAAALSGRDDAVIFAAQPWHRGDFIEDLVEAVRHLRPEFGRRTLAAHAAGSTPEKLAAPFLADLRNVESTLVLAIDNVEHFAEDRFFERFLETLATALPSHAHLLLSGRALPSLETASLVVKGEATIVPPDALTFSEEELSQLLQARGRSAGDDAVDALYRETHGWAAAVELALIAPDGASLVSQELALAYVSETILARLDEEQRHFLERISVYERLDPRIFDSDARSDFDARIAELERAGMPITRGPGSLILHPLVRAAALADAARAASLADAHADAARRYAAAGNHSASLYHLIASASAQHADALLREDSLSFVRTGNHERVREALRLLDDGSADVRAYVEALLEKTSGSDRVDHLLEIAACSDDPSIAFSARAEQLERRIAKSREAPLEALDDLQSRALPLGAPSQARVQLLRAWSLAVGFDFRGALDLLAPLSGAGDSSEQFNIGVLAAYAHAARGHALPALAELDRLVRLFENDDRVVFQTLTLVWQARLALVLGHTSAAADAARAALRIVESLSVSAEEAALYSALAEVAASEGNVEETVRFAERLAASAPYAWYAGDVTRAKALAEISLARAAFLGRDFTTAKDLAVRASRETAFPTAQRAAAASEASAYLALLDDATAREVHERAIELIADANPLDAADAVAIAQANDIAAFLAGINAWTLPVEPAALHPFGGLLEARRGLVTSSHAAIALANLRNGTATPEPFNAALAQMSRDGERFETRLLRAFAPRDSVSKSQPPTQSFELTAREMEILSLLVDGLSNKEIAQRLVLSPRTVETHVERVLGKLEVGSRSRAIAKALRLGIVRFSES